MYDEGPDGLTLRGRFPVPVPADARAVVLPPAAVRPELALLLPNDGDLSCGITGSLRRLLADQLEDLRRSLTVRSAR